MRVRAPFRITFDKPRSRKWANVYCYRFSRCWGEWGYWYNSCAAAFADVEYPAYKR